MDAVRGPFARNTTPNSATYTTETKNQVHVLVRPCNGCLWQQRYITTAVLVASSDRLDYNSGEVPRHIIYLYL